MGRSFERTGEIQQGSGSVIPYFGFMDEFKKGESRMGQLSESANVAAEGKVLYVAEMRALAREWSGVISAENVLDSQQTDVYTEYINQSIVAVQPGGQRGCMDGRCLPEQFLLGPKTAGGTFCDPIRVMLATKAFDEYAAMNYDGALEFIEAVDKKYSFKSGGHKLDQCGAFKNAVDAIAMISEQADTISESVEIFLGAVLSPYSESIQKEIITAARSMHQLIEGTDGYRYLRGGEYIQDTVRRANPDASPELGGKHKELAIVVFTQPGATLDNNRLINKTIADPTIHSERQAFGYNWDYHKIIADELEKRVGRGAGAYYLHAVPSQDIPILQKLTDGSLSVYAFDPTIN